MEHHDYDSTVSSSKEESLLKAIEILKNEQSTCRHEIERPDIKVGIIVAKKLLRLFILALQVTFLSLSVIRFGFSPLLSLVIGAITFIIIISVGAKRACCDWILLYQKLAPERMRASCLFVPSCSQYTLIAIEKYGVIKGIGKGVKRILRCHPPNGGEDYP